MWRRKATTSASSASLRTEDRGSLSPVFKSSTVSRFHHTDRGGRYCLHDYRKLLRQHGFKVLMSGKGNCHAIAAVETAFRPLKAGLIRRWSWETRQAETAIFEYVNGFYNPRRRDSASGWKSPVAFERKVAKTSTWGGTKAGQVQNQGPSKQPMTTALSCRYSSGRISLG